MGDREIVLGVFGDGVFGVQKPKNAFLLLLQKKHSISVLKVKELTPQNQILAMNTLKSFKLNFLTAGVVYSIAQKRQRQPVHCCRKIEKQCKNFFQFSTH